MIRQELGIAGILALGAAISAVGCASAGEASAGGRSSILADNPDALIQMRRSACSSNQCSVYGVSVFTDGTVAYDGRANVNVVGQRQAKISAESLSDLISTIDAMDFLDLPESCCVCPATAAYQIITLDYRPGSAQKTVLHDSGCGSAFPAVTGLEQAIDRATGVARWTTAPVPAARKVAESTVPASRDILELSPAPAAPIADAPEGDSPPEEGSPKALPAAAP